MIVVKLVRTYSDQRHGEHKTKLNILIPISLKDESKVQLSHYVAKLNKINHSISEPTAVRWYFTIIEGWLTVLSFTATHTSCS